MWIFMTWIKKNEIFLLEKKKKKNFISKYKESYLGILWTILSPLLMMLLFTIIFSTIFGRNIENYPVYFLSGWCLFMFFNSALNTSMNALKGNKNILQRTPAPKYVFICGTIISELLNFIIMLILLLVIIIATNAQLHFPIMLLAIIPIFSLILMITGLGLMLSIICVYYTDVKHLWSVVSMMIMYASAIFYPMNIIPMKYRKYLLLNPLYWIVEQFRAFVYLGTFPSLISIINALLISSIILVLGIIVFKKYEKRITLKL